MAVIPNSVLNNEVVENSSYNDDTTIANFLNIQVSYESDIDKALEIVNSCVKSHPNFVKDKDPTVVVRNLGPDGYDVRATIWTNSVSENFIACSDLRVMIKKEFDKQNISIPYPHTHIITG